MNWRMAFVERTRAISDLSGLPPSTVRVFAWLIVCDPPEQSVYDLRDALGLSTGAISGATSTLVRMGIAERISQPRDRRQRYRLLPGGWDRMLRARIEASAHMRALADETLAVAPGPQPRLVEMRDFYGWFEREMGARL